MDKKIRNFETKPYYSGRLLWDIAVLFSVFAGVSYDDERRFYAGVSLKAGVGMYSSNPFF